MDDEPGEQWIEGLRLFYTIDRDTYTILVRDLSRNPTESLHVMGMWLWYESLGIPQVISKIWALTPRLIDRLADEALSCIGAAMNPGPFLPVEVPLTRTLLETDVFLHHLSENRIYLFYELQRMLDDTYYQALSDLVNRAHRASFGSSSSSTPSSQGQSPVTDNLARNFSRLTVGGNEDMSALTNEMAILSRTMYALFTEAGPVTEPEIREYFNALLGNSIESVHMHEVMPGEQPLYARVCCISPMFPQAFLNGETMLRLEVNGKRVSFVKYLPRMGRRLSCGCMGPGWLICPLHGGR